MKQLTRTLRIATLNVRGLSTKKKQNQLYRLANELDLDVLAVQETKVEGDEQTGSMVHRFTTQYNCVVSHAVGMSAGCVLFVRQSVGVQVNEVTTGQSGRLVVCDFTLSGLEWRIVCLYAPNLVDERRALFEGMRQYCDSDKLLILLGDFNCVLAAGDKTSARPFRDASTVALGNLLQDYALEDVAECLEGGRAVRFTHFQAASHARLDRAYVTMDLVPLCHDYCVQPVTFSDHCLVAFSIRGSSKQDQKFNWELWKMNSRLLNDEEFSSCLKKRLEKYNADNKTRPGVKWETFKQQTKIYAVERSVAIKREERIKETILRDNLEKLTREECRMPGEFMSEIRTVKHKLDALETERYRGAMVRARAERIIADEAPTKRALGTEKWHARRNHIAEVEWQGVITSDKDDIENCFFQYYKELFAHSSVDVQRFKREYLHLLPRLNDETKELLELPISIEEVANAIKDLNPGKSPGPDGLIAAFYKAFRHELAPILTDVYNEAYDIKVVPPSFTVSHTVLIPKTEDPVLLRQSTSYRPISLTNVDYKIFMKILAKRLQTVMTELVGPHQTCGIKGRTIFTNIHTARCVLECCDAIGNNVAMLQLDLEKAFDRVPHEILLCILEYANVGCVVREGVAMTYRCCTTRLIVNKAVGRSIEVQRSVRQGCPLSPLLFCLYIETLCLSIIRSESVQGFRLHGAEVKLLAYADDIAVFCSDVESVNTVVEIVKRACKVNGSSVNWKKCLGFWHGNWPLTPSIFANMNWVNTPAKYLGVPLEFYKDSDPYWRKEAAEMRERAEKWKGWNLSMFSRTTVCNLFFVCKLWYVLQVLHCSRANVQRLHRVLAVFIWGSNWERTSRTNLFRRVRDGGLGLAHLFVRQIVNRFLFFREVRDPTLRTVCQLRLGRALPDIIVTTNAMPGGLHGFMREVVLSVRFLAVRFSWEYLCQVNRKKLYKDVCNVVLPEPMYRMIYRAGRGKDVLKRVKRMQVPPSVKSFFFKLHTGTLSVKAWMVEKQLFVPWGIDCLICKKVETIEHVFIDCWDAVFLWDVLQRTLKKSLPVDAHGIRYLPVENEDGMPYDLIMLVGLNCIWKARMAARYSDIDARSARQYFREAMSAYVENQKYVSNPPECIVDMESLVRLKDF